jgi:ribosomal protein L9
MKKNTKLVISAYTRKKHTPPVGTQIEILMPHDKAVAWAEKIVPVLNNMRDQIEAENAESNQQAQQTTQPE